MRLVLEKRFFFSTKCRYWSFSVWHKMFLGYERFNRFGINSVILFFSGLYFILINFPVSLIYLLIYLIVRFYSHHLSVFLKQCQHFIVNNMFMDVVKFGNFATYNSHICCLKMWGPKDNVYKLIWQIIWASSEHSYVERICIWYTCAKVTHIHFTHICEHSNRNVCFCK